MPIQNHIAEDLSRAPDADALRAIVEHGQRLRDMQLHKDDLLTQVKRLDKDINEMQHRTLPDMMQDAGVDRVGLPAAGNLPPYDITCKPFYKANIAASWPPEKRAQAFNLLKEKDLHDIIRIQLVIDVPVGDMELRQRLHEFLDMCSISYSENLSVPWKTLTAVVREQTEAGRPFNPHELDRLGAVVGKVVELKERKL